MFPKAYRLPKSMRPQGILKGSSFFVKVRTAENNLSHNRYGFVVSKKIDKRAVIRNRLKRQYRACLHLLGTGAKEGRDMLFLIQKQAALQKTRALFEDLKRLLKNV